MSALFLTPLILTIIVSAGAAREGELSNISLNGEKERKIRVNNLLNADRDHENKGLNFGYKHKQQTVKQSYKHRHQAVKKLCKQSNK